MTDEEIEEMRQLLHANGNRAMKYESKWMNTERELQAERARTNRLIDSLRGALCLTEPYPRKIVLDALVQYQEKK